MFWQTIFMILSVSIKFQTVPFPVVSISNTIIVANNYGLRQVPTELGTYKYQQKVLL